MQIKINLAIFFFIIIFLLTHQIEIYAWVMLFALIHELGHMITGIILKLKPKLLSFMPFGVSITFETYGYRKLIEIKKIVIAMAGPLTNLIICIITFFLHINLETKTLIMYANILIVLFNLMPLYPLDGGRILKGLIRFKYKTIEADKIVNKISNILIILLTIISSFLILYIKNICILFILIYLWVIVLNENKKYKFKQKIHDSLRKIDKSIDI